MGPFCNNNGGKKRVIASGKEEYKLGEKKKTDKYGAAKSVKMNNTK